MLTGILVLLAMTLPFTVMGCAFFQSLKDDDNKLDMNARLRACTNTNGSCTAISRVGVDYTKVDHIYW